MTQSAKADRQAVGQAGLSRLRLTSALRTGVDTSVIALYAITVLLVGFGLIMVLSSSSITSYLEDQGFLGGFWRQATFALIGLPLMIIASVMPLNFWKRNAWRLFALTLLLQLLVFTSLGIEVGGNRNWIQIGSITAQPSEMLKISLAIWIATVLLRKEKLLGKMRHELIPVVLPGTFLALLLVLLGRDLGTSLVLAAIAIGAMFFGGVSWKSIALTVFTGAIAVAMLVVTSPNRMDRLFNHASGSSDYSGLGWQSQHGIWALAEGGLFGVGLGGSKAKWSWLPAADNDYIFAIIGEELGLVGALLVILMFVALAVIMLRVISKSRDRFGRAVVGGVMVWVVGQALINIGVVIRVFPVLGLPLPLISSGGTALIACLIAIGVVISVARDNSARGVS